MNTLNRYITRDFLITFAFTLSVLTFVMSIAGLVKAIDLLSRGVSGVFLLKMFLSNIPYMLMFSIPMSTLSSTLLMVGRLSLGGGNHRHESLRIEPVANRRASHRGFHPAFGSLHVRERQGRS